MSRRLVIRRLGRIGYAEGVELQKSLVAQRQAGEVEADVQAGPDVGIKVGDREPAGEAVGPGGDVAGPDSRKVIRRPSSVSRNVAK